MTLKILFPIFFIGLLILQAQVLLFREMLVSSQGNELAVGMMLWLWLSSTGLGSLAGGRLLRKSRIRFRPSTFLLGMALTLPSGIAGMRALPSLLGYPAGELLPLPLLFFLGLMALMPFCFCSGFLFPLLGRTVFLWFSMPAQAIGRVYLCEALGAAAGGVLGVLTLPRINGLPLAFFIGSGLSACSLWISLNLTREKSRKRPAVISGIIGTLCLVFSIFPGKDLDLISRSFQWRPYLLKAVRETPFGSLLLHERAGQFNFFLNGSHQFSVPDPRAAEEKTHLPLLFHPAPGKVFLIGGGPSGMLREILKHPSLKSVEYVEMDRVWIESAGQFRPELPGLLADPRIKSIFGDGRPVLAGTRGGYDVVLIAFPGPDSLLLNRFYTREFFQTVKDRLNPEGLVAFSLEGPTDMMGAAQLAVLRNLYQTLSAVFPGVTVASGEEIHFFGFADRTAASTPVSTIIRRISERNLQFRYLNPLQVEAVFSPWRKNYFQALLSREKTGRLNQDLTPNAFFYQTGYHLAHQYPALAELFSKGSRVSLPYVILVLVIGFVLLGTWLRIPSAGAPTLPVLMAVGVAGFSGLALEILILILFQVFLGYLYLEIGSLIACFMAGLALGAHVLTGLKGDRQSRRGLTVGLQVLLGFSCLVLIIFLQWNSLPRALQSPGLQRAIVYSFMLLTGLIAGGHYLLCSRALLALGEGLEKTAGGLYGIDLFGAALGGLATGFLCLPVWGIESTLFLLLLTNLLAAGLLLVWKGWGKIDGGWI
jgi:spermidine synthase